MSSLGYSGTKSLGTPTANRGMTMPTKTFETLRLEQLEEGCSPEVAASLARKKIARREKKMNRKISEQSGDALGDEIKCEEDIVESVIARSKSYDVSRKTTFDPTRTEIM